MRDLIEIINQSLFEAAVTTAQAGGSEFKSWFAGAKIVDSDKKPLVVHHFTYNDFTEFDRQWAARRFNRDPEGFDTIGLWFTANPEARYVSADASMVGKRMDAMLAIRKPLVLKDNRFDDCAAQLQQMVTKEGGSTALRERLKAEGHDGIVFDNSRLDQWRQTVIIAFEPSQVRIVKTHNVADLPNEERPQHDPVQPFLPKPGCSPWWMQALQPMSNQLPDRQYSWESEGSFDFAEALAQAYGGKLWSVAHYDDILADWQAEHAVVRIGTEYFDFRGVFDHEAYIAKQAATDKRRGRGKIRRAMKNKNATIWSDDDFLNSSQKQMLLAALTTGQPLPG